MFAVFTERGFENGLSGFDRKNWGLMFLGGPRQRYAVTMMITYGAKLLNADWLRRRAFFLNHEGTFGNQEGMITSF